MYSKSNILLFIAYTVCTGLLIFSKQYEVQAGSVDSRETVTVETECVELARLESVERVISYETMEQRLCIDVSEKALETLMRIVEAEAGGEDQDGKLLVANVVLNRMNDEHFPDTVSEVVFQREKGVSQFSPVANGSFYRVKISDETISAVGRALMGEDISQGALYFVARKYADGSKLKWFDNHLTYLFVHGGHEFFK